MRVRESARVDLPEVLKTRATVRHDEDIVACLWPFLRGRTTEVFWCMALDGKHRVLGLHEVSVGTLSSSLVHPREIFRFAIQAGAAAIVVAHNHPSGDPEPSPEDIAVTQRIEQAGKLLGIPLLDHVVVGFTTNASREQSPDAVSLRSRGYVS